MSNTRNIPDKWYIRITEGNKSLLEKWRGSTFEGTYGIILSERGHTKGYWTYNSVGYENYEEISTQEFIEGVMGRKITGYLAPYDFVGVTDRVKKGTLFTCPSEGMYYTNLAENGYRKNRLPREIVETWVPVTDDVENIHYFGNVEFRIDPSTKLAATKYGKITMTEIEEMLHYIDNPPKLLNYHLSVDKELPVLMNNTDYCYIGCVQGSVGQLRDIYTAFKS